MVRSFALFCLLGCVIKTSCVQGSCGPQPEAAAPQGAASCGCENLKRAAAVEPVEDRTAAAEPADKYSRGANEGPHEARGDEERVQSEVICLPFIYWTADSREEDMRHGEGEDNMQHNPLLRLPEMLSSITFLT